LGQFVSIARLVKTRGVRGEVKAEPLTDFPERFSSLSGVRVWKEGTEYREEIEDHWFQQDRLILKFRGRNSPEEVEELIGGEVQVPEEERVRLPEDRYYYSDLIGCGIVQGGERLGQVEDVLEIGAAGYNLVVRGRGGEEFMIPLVRRFVLAVDPQSKEIEVDLPAGLMSGA